MDDPSLNGSHLGMTRNERYDAAVDEMLDGRGPVTAEPDPLARVPSVSRPPSAPQMLPPGDTYTLVSFPDVQRHVSAVESSQSAATAIEVPISRGYI